MNSGSALHYFVKLTMKTRKWSRRRKMRKRRGRAMETRGLF